MRCLLIIPALSLTLLAGCANKSDKTGDDHVGQLREKASIIGQQELARFNAADLLYKNIPELHTTIVPIIERKRHIWVKTYRRYSDFEVLDITRTQSLLAPIAFSIAYNYEQFSTQYRVTDELKNALDTSLKDTNYELRISDSFIRYYRCDENGDLVDSSPPLPLRPDYFQTGYNDEAALGSPP